MRYAMISVLIPNYNYDCLQLVRDLHAQLTCCGYPFEIIVAEDGSTECLENNRRMQTLAHVNYQERKENMGRFGMRKLLPSLARYPYLVCMDSDTQVIRQDYIRKYLDFALRGEKCVVVGGKTEADGGLPAPCYSLRFTYERKRENRPGHKKGFSTFNYMAPAEVLKNISFEEGQMLAYGHEDTVMGVQFKRLGVPVVYIDNPLVHIGLDTNERMMEKSVAANVSLLRLYNSGRYPELPGESRLLACYLKVNRFGLAPLLRFVYRISEKAVLKNLDSLHPSMWLFDFYRLGKMLSLNR